MASSALEEVVNVGLCALGSRSGDDQTGVIDVAIKVVKSRRYVSSTTSLETEPTAWRRVVRVPMEDFVRGGETAIHSSRQLLLWDPIVEREVIPNAAARISVRLRSFTHSAMQRGFNFMQIQVELRIVRVFQGFLPPHHDLREQPQASDDVGLEFYSYFDDDEDDAAFLDDDEDDQDEEDRAAMDWATTESMNGDIHPSSSHYDMHEVEAFLTSCRAQTWDSNTQCIICLECLGAAAAVLLELQLDQHQAGGKKELEGMICRLPCSHLFHVGCISKWFQGRDTCPICRRSFHPSLL